MKRVVVVSEIPVSYRHRWFGYVRANTDIDLRVLYLAQSQSDRPWETGETDEAWARVLPGRSITAADAGFFARFSPAIGRALRHESPDLVLLPGWAHPAAWQAAMWCERRGVPYGVMFENWKQQTKTRVPASVGARIRSLILDNAAVALPAGERAAAYARSITRAPIRILHANVADVEAARAASSTPDPNERRVLYLGRLMPHKGIDSVLAVCDSLAGSGIIVDVAGDGPSRPLVEAAAQRGSVVYHGPVSGDHKHKLMGQATVAVVPSLEEPWGVVVQEILATGTPVIASTEVGSAQEFIEEGVTGMIVEPRAAALERAVRAWLSQDPHDSARCAESAARVSYRSTTDELASVGEKFAA